MVASIIEISVLAIVVLLCYFGTGLWDPTEHFDSLGLTIANCDTPYEMTPADGDTPATYFGVGAALAATMQTDSVLTFQYNVLDYDSDFCTTVNTARALGDDVYMATLTEEMEKQEHIIGVYIPAGYSATVLGLATSALTDTEAPVVTVGIDESASYVVGLLGTSLLLELFDTLGTTLGTALTASYLAEVGTTLTSMSSALTSILTATDGATIAYVAGLAASSIEPSTALTDLSSTALAAPLQVEFVPIRELGSYGVFFATFMPTLFGWLGIVFTSTLAIPTLRRKSDSKNNGIIRAVFMVCVAIVLSFCIALALWGIDLEQVSDFSDCMRAFLSLAVGLLGCGGLLAIIYSTLGVAGNYFGVLLLVFQFVACGFIVPADLITPWISNMAYILPMKHALSIFKHEMFDAFSISSLTANYAILAGWAVVGYGIGALCWSKGVAKKVGERIFQVNLLSFRALARAF
ncbi:hypothetical protein KIPB_004529 [Kipferlia bialata]|uniref:DUF3533 domain-containing protein n=1 Tax=Kipferlia bialata TaxID=797122 RepID=A0A9K3CTW9_9EUKA|nr:hypothetical protein KIPB_004529 [Kipferlia bialata]|eukprot:g4529.t1